MARNASGSPLRALVEMRLPEGVSTALSDSIFIFVIKRKNHGENGEDLDCFPPCLRGEKQPVTQLRVRLTRPETVVIFRPRWPPPTLPRAERPGPRSRPCTSIGKSVWSEPLTLDISISASRLEGALTLTFPLTDEKRMSPVPSSLLMSTSTFPLTADAVTSPATS